MSTISDPRVDEILATHACSSLPPSVSTPAYRLTRLLLASRSWSDVAVFTSVMRLPDGRFLAPVSGKWGLAFSWIDGLGARELALQRV